MAKDDTPLWTAEPQILWERWNEIIPYGWMSPHRKANALTRIGIIVGAAFLVNYLRGGKGLADLPPSTLAGLAAIGAVVLVVIVVMRRRRRERATEPPPTQHAACMPVVDMQDACDIKSHTIDRRAMDRQFEDLTLDPTEADQNWLVGNLCRSEC